jgi:D-aspartate ligase
MISAGTTVLYPMDASTPAVVLKFDANVMHHGGLGVIRSLGRNGVPVYAVHEDKFAPAASSRYVRGRLRWRPDPDDTDRVLAGLARLAAIIGRPAVLFPTDDAGAIFLAEHDGELRHSFLFPELSADLPRRLAGKYSLHQVCREFGVASPRATLPESLAAAREFARGTGYPVIAKLTDPWQDHRGLRSTRVVADPGELGRVYGACGRAGAGLMLQEFVPGGRGHDWFFHGYCDKDSVCRPAFTGVKERSYPSGAGLTSFGRSAPNGALRGEITRLLTRLGYRGLVDLDIRLDARDGRCHLLDFNPRLGAQFRVFRDTAGTDVALAAYLDLTGQPIPEAAQVDGRSFVVENYDPISALRRWRAGELGWRSWLASVRDADEWAWFAREDLRPFGLMCARMGWRALTRKLAGHQPSPPVASSPGRPARPADGFRYQPGRSAGRFSAGRPGSGLRSAGLRSAGLHSAGLHSAGQPVADQHSADQHSAGQPGDDRPGGSAGGSMSRPEHRAAISTGRNDCDRFH